MSGRAAPIWVFGGGHVNGKHIGGRPPTAAAHVIVDARCSPRREQRQQQPQELEVTPSPASVTATSVECVAASAVACTDAAKPAASPAPLSIRPAGVPVSSLSALKLPSAPSLLLHAAPPGAPVSPPPRAQPRAAPMSSLASLSSLQPNGKGWEADSQAVTIAAPRFTSAAASSRVAAISVDKPAAGSEQRGDDEEPTATRSPASNASVVAVSRPNSSSGACASAPLSSGSRRRDTQPGSGGSARGRPPPPPPPPPHSNASDDESDSAMAEGQKGGSVRPARHAQISAPSAAETRMLLQTPLALPNPAPACVLTAAAAAIPAPSPVPSPIAHAAGVNAPETPIPEPRLTRRRSHRSGSTHGSGHSRVSAATRASDASRRKSPARRSVLPVKVYEVERILDKRRQRGLTQYRVKWVGYPESESTWETQDQLEGAAEIVANYEEEQRKQAADAAAARARVLSATPVVAAAAPAPSARAAPHQPIVAPERARVTRRSAAVTPTRTKQSAAASTMQAQDAVVAAAPTDIASSATVASPAAVAASSRAISAALSPPPSPRAHHTLACLANPAHRLAPVAEVRLRRIDVNEPLSQEEGASARTSSNTLLTSASHKAVSTAKTASSQCIDPLLDRAAAFCASSTLLSVFAALPLAPADSTEARERDVAAQRLLDSAPTWLVECEGADATRWPVELESPAPAASAAPFSVQPVSLGNGLFSSLLHKLHRDEHVGLIHFSAEPEHSGLVMGILQPITLQYGFLKLVRTEQLDTLVMPSQRTAVLEALREHTDMHRAAAAAEPKRAARSSFDPDPATSAFSSSLSCSSLCHPLPASFGLSTAPLTVVRSYPDYTLLLPLLPDESAGVTAVAVDTDAPMQDVETAADAPALQRSETQAATQPLSQDNAMPSSPSRTPTVLVLAPPHASSSTTATVAAPSPPPAADSCSSLLLRVRALYDAYLVDDSKGVEEMGSLFTEIDRAIVPKLEKMWEREKVAAQELLLERAVTEPTGAVEGAPAHPDEGTPITTAPSIVASSSAPALASSSSVVTPPGPAVPLHAPSDVSFSAFLCRHLVHLLRESPTSDRVRKYVPAVLLTRDPKLMPRKWRWICLQLHVRVRYVAPMLTHEAAAAIASAAPPTASASSLSASTSSSSASAPSPLPDAAAAASLEKECTVLLRYFNLHPFLDPASLLKLLAMPCYAPPAADSGIAWARESSVRLLHTCCAKVECLPGSLPDKWMGRWHAAHGTADATPIAPYSATPIRHPSLVATAPLPSPSVPSPSLVADPSPAPAPAPLNWIEANLARQDAERAVKPVAAASNALPMTQRVVALQRRSTQCSSLSMRTGPRIVHHTIIHVAGKKRDRQSASSKETGPKQKHTQPQPQQQPPPPPARRESPRKKAKLGADALPSIVVTPAMPAATSIRALASDAAAAASSAAAAAAAGAVAGHASLHLSPPPSAGSRSSCRSLRTPSRSPASDFRIEETPTKSDDYGSSPEFVSGSATRARAAAAKATPRSAIKRKLFSSPQKPRASPTPRVPRNSGS